MRSRTASKVGNRRGRLSRQAVCPAELVARVHAILRRVQAKPENKSRLCGRNARPVTRETRQATCCLQLTVTEFNLLHLLLRHPPPGVDAGRSCNEVWGYDFGGDDNVLEIYIGYLRKKLEADGRARLIHTVRGIGYVLHEE